MEFEQLETMNKMMCEIHSFYQKLSKPRVKKDIINGLSLQWLALLHPQPPGDWMGVHWENMNNAKDIA